MTSLRAKLIVPLLRLLGVKRVFDDPVLLEQAAARLNAGGPARPGWRRERKFSIQRERVGGHLVFVVAPRRRATGERVLFLHGGAYLVELAFIHWRMIEGIIDRTGATLVVPIYPLAPAAGWDDVYGLIRTVYERLIEGHGADAVSIVGDSAGGGLGLAACMVLRDHARPLPRSLVLLSPWLDATGAEAPDQSLDRHDPVLGARGLHAAALAYAGGMDLADPRISPLFGNLSGLPPILLLTGTNDLLNADAHRLREKAQADGAELRFHEYQNMIHDWMGLPLSEADVALDEVAAFIARGRAPGTS